MNKHIKTLRGIIFYNLGFLEARFYWKTRKYLKKYYSRREIVPANSQKTLIYMVDGRAYSGGISDILKGVVSMFKFSKEIGFDFRINFCFPFDLRDYLEPNEYDWAVSGEEISYNSEYSVPLWLYLSMGKSRDFIIEYEKKVLHRFIRKNKEKQQFHIYTNSEWAWTDEYSRLFNELFKPGSALQEVISRQKKKLGNEYISMTFRFQQLLGDFEAQKPSIDRTAKVIDLVKKTLGGGGDVLPDHGELQIRALLGDFKNKKISVALHEEEVNRLIGKCINQVKEIRSSLFPNKNILITADSKSFLSQVRRLSFVNVISIDNIYSKSISDELYKIFVKIFVDILVLSEANKLFLLCEDRMYSSAFAKNASYINNREYQEIKF